jgi:Rrf2 family protein
MKISTKGRYGLRILLDVALNQEKGPVALSEIARRQTLSQKYLWQVINPLKTAGFLRAIRGTQGGYVLARPPNEITVRDIVEVLEGPVSLVACVADPKTCERSVDCTARGVWAEIETKMNSAMSGITLRDIVQRHKESESRSGPNYTI